MQETQQHIEDTGIAGYMQRLPSSNFVRFSSLTEWASLFFLKTKRRQAKKELVLREKKNTRLQAHEEHTHCVLFQNSL